MNSIRYGVGIQATLLANVICFFCINYEANGQSPTGELHDRDGNIYSIKTMPDNKKWMTANLNINIPGSYGYENAAQKNDQYGRLYTWKPALEGCKLLGEGWRLPTNEEWQKMAKCYGGVRDDSEDGGKAAYQALVKGGNAAFNAVYGGGLDAADGSYARVDAHGFYWTATESDTAKAWLYNFGKNGKILNRHPDGEKHMAISVRCIMDTGNVKEQ
ncbi:MAG TPA: FISUMP domain-containing protein [Chitinophagaceae bacterium]|nr:FISUMP domain-containing protein [Chitinophagaceae bacterium]